MSNNYSVIAQKISYKSGFKKIINDISLAVLKNEYVGIIGGSGSGKTTLLNCLSTAKEISSGKVLLKGISSEETEKIRQFIGYVPQEDIVHSSLTAERALYFSCMLRINENKDDKEIEAKVNSVLTLLELAEHKDKKISKLSGGQRKRVNIGLELLHSPDIFFLDEPSSGLDPLLEKQLMVFLKNLTKDGRTIFVSTHLMQNINLFDLIIFIHKGHMVYFGPVNYIKDYFQVNDYVDIFEKVSKNTPEALASIFLKSGIYNSFLLKRINEIQSI